jgi:2-aminoadipate transaminase
MCLGVLAILPLVESQAARNGLAMTAIVLVANDHGKGSKIAVAAAVLVLTVMTISYARRMDRVRPSAIRELLQLGADPEVLSFGGGYPDPALFPMEHLHAVFNELLVVENALALQYTTSNGLPELRSQVAARLSRDGMPCDLNEVLIIQGGQQGLDLCAKLVLDAGDTVITEDPTFLGALIAFNAYEPDYAPVRTDDDGMDMDHLEQTLAAHPDAKMLYTVPDFQNPTGVTLSRERRHRLIELANRHDLLVVEDTPYRSLRYEGDHVPTLKSLDTEGRVVHLGSFSKILAPGMRLGWAVASPEILTRLALLKLAADTQSSTLNMAATSAYLSKFDIDAHISATLPVYRHKRDLMLQTISATFPDTIAYTRPQGGLFTWLTFPDGFDAEAFMRRQMLPLAKVAYVPGATFFPVRRETNHARVSFSGIPDNRLIDGITAIGDLLHKALG